MWPPAHLTTTNMALNMMQQNMIVESLITNLASITWSETSPIYWSDTRVHLAALTWSDQNPCPSDHQPSLVLPTISHNDQKLCFPPHGWSLDINRTFTTEWSFITWSTRTEYAVLQLWSYLDYRTVFSTVWHSQDQLLSMYDDKVSKPYWLTNLKPPDQHLCFAPPVIIALFILCVYLCQPKNVIHDALPVIGWAVRTEAFSVIGQNTCDE